MSLQPVAHAAGQYATLLLSTTLSPLLYDCAAHDRFANNVAELGQAGIKATLDQLGERRALWEISFKLIAEQRSTQPRETEAEALAAVRNGFAKIVRELNTRLYVDVLPHTPALFLKV